MKLIEIKDTSYTADIIIKISKEDYELEDKFIFAIIITTEYGVEDKYYYSDMRSRNNDYTRICTQLSTYEENPHLYNHHSNPPKFSKLKLEDMEK